MPFPPLPPSFPRKRESTEIVRVKTGIADAVRFLNNMAQMRREVDYKLIPPLRFYNRSIDSQELVDFALDISQRLLASLDRYSPGAAPDGCRCPVVHVRR